MFYYNNCHLNGIYLEAIFVTNDDNHPRRRRLNPLDFLLLFWGGVILCGAAFVACIVGAVTYSQQGDEGRAALFALGAAIFFLVDLFALLWYWHSES